MSAFKRTSRTWDPPVDETPLVPPTPSRRTGQERRYDILDLTTAENRTVTSCLAVSYRIDGNLITFEDRDGNPFIVAMLPGWGIIVES